MISGSPPSAFFMASFSVWSEISPCVSCTAQQRQRSITAEETSPNNTLGADTFRLAPPKSRVQRLGSEECDGERLGLTASEFKALHVGSCSLAFPLAVNDGGSVRDADETSPPLADHSICAGSVGGGAPSIEARILSCTRPTRVRYGKPCRVEPEAWAEQYRVFVGDSVHVALFLGAPPLQPHAAQLDEDRHQSAQDGRYHQHRQFEFRVCQCVHTTISFPQHPNDQPAEPEPGRAAVLVQSRPL